MLLRLGLFWNRNRVQKLSKKSKQILTAFFTSSKVAENDCIKSCGKSVINPTVSINRTPIPHGSFPRWTVVSSVANNLSSGSSLQSPESALAKVVLPEKMKYNVAV